MCALRHGSGVARKSLIFAILKCMIVMVICQQIWSYQIWSYRSTIYGGMAKPLIHARLVVIDTLQLVESSNKPKIRSSNLG